MISPIASATDHPIGTSWISPGDGVLGTAPAGAVFSAWLAALALFVVIVAGLRLLQGLAARRLARAGAASATRLDTFPLVLVRKIHPLFLIFLGVYLASFLVAPPSRLAGVLHLAMILALLAQIAIWGNSAIDLLIRRQNQRLYQDGERATTLTALGYLARITMWSLVLLLALDNIGVNITALVAGLGITGIAVALAVQNILGDLFASLSIVLDKPFVLGDFITVDSYMGHVEYIGLKTTRIRSVFGEEIIFSNADLLRSRIRNYKRMTERRVVLTLSVTYENGYDRLRAIPDLVRGVVEQQSARFGGAHFRAFRDFALDFDVEYFVAGHDETLHKEILQAINLGVYRRFHESDIEFAHQVTAHTQKMPSTTAPQGSP